MHKVYSRCVNAISSIAYASPIHFRKFLLPFFIDSFIYLFICLGLTLWRLPLLDVCSASGMLLTHALLADRHIKTPSPSFLSLSLTLTNLWTEMLKIVKCETADTAHRNKALSGCLDILKGFLTGITAIPLNLNSDLCVMGAMFIEEFSVLETPPYIQATPSIHTKTYSHTPSHSSLTKNRLTQIHPIDENSTMSKSRSNSNSSDVKHVNKDYEKNMQVNKMKNMKVENDESSMNKDKEKDEDKNKYVNIQGNEIEEEEEEEEGEENNKGLSYKNEITEEGRSMYHDDNDNDNDNEEDDNSAIRDWLHYCDQSGIDLSLSHAQTVFLSSLNEQNNNSNVNNNSSNGSSSNSKAGEGSRSRTGSVRSSTTPTHDRERGRDRGRDRDSIDDKIAQTRARSHLLLALPSIVSIICLNIPHTPHTSQSSTHTSSNYNAGTNTSVNPSSASNSNEENGENEENEGLKQLRAAACRAVSRVDMTALVESYNGLEDRAKTLKAENTLLQVEVNNLNANANAANLPF